MEFTNFTTSTGFLSKFQIKHKGEQEDTKSGIQTDIAVAQGCPSC